MSVDESVIYEKMYLMLFNAVTDALGVIEENPLKAKELLEQAQRKCEDIFIENEEL